VKFLLNSFREDDIETLLFLLHNIGLQLRKADPEGLKICLLKNETVTWLR
jgi:hypothetical protein